MKPPPDLPVQNVEAYMAGYLLLKSKIGTCDLCKSQLIPPKNEMYEFLRQKAYREEDTLIYQYPTKTFVQLIENVETIFVTVFDTVKCMSNVLIRSSKSTLSCGEDYLVCENDICRIKLNDIIKLYTEVRMFHVLKMSNREFKVTKGVKKNKKLINLPHK